MRMRIGEFRKMSTWFLLVGAIALTLGTQPVLSSASSTELKIGKKAEINLSETTQVRDVVLEAGYYQVRHQDGPGESHALVFTRMAANDAYGYSSLRTAKDEVSVRCHVHPLYLKNKHTMVYIGAHDGEPVIKKIMIRGENVEHRFDQ